MGRRAARRGARPRDAQARRHPVRPVLRPERGVGPAAAHRDPAARRAWPDPRQRGQAARVQHRSQRARHQPPHDRPHPRRGHGRVRHPHGVGRRAGHRAGPGRRPGAAHRGQGLRRAGQARRPRRCAGDARPVPRDRARAPRGPPVPGRIARRERHRHGDLGRHRLAWQAHRPRRLGKLAGQPAVGLQRCSRGRHGRGQQRRDPRQRPLRTACRARIDPAAHRRLRPAVHRAARPSGLRREDRRQSRQLRRRARCGHGQGACPRHRRDVRPEQPRRLRRPTSWATPPSRRRTSRDRSTRS